MNESPPPESSSDPPSAKRPHRIVRILVNAIGPVIILIIAWVIVQNYYQNRPTAPQRSRERLPRLLDVREIYPADRSIVVEAMGTIVPALEVQLRPRVNGEILSISDSFIPGGLFRKGETILEIDPRDYELNVLQAEAAVAQANSNLRLEEGQQDVAQKDFELLGDQLGEEDLEYVLREPQRQAAEANLMASRARLDEARLNLERTRLTAPFDALVVSRAVNQGTVVNASTNLARMVGTDEYWIELEVPVDALRWIRIPQSEDDPGSLVRIYDTNAWSPGRYREGRVLRTTAEVDRQSRLATLIVSVKDPLALQPGNEGLPPLILNAFIKAEIFGQTLEEVYSVPRDFVRDNDTLWIFNEEEKLEIRSLEPVYRGRRDLVVTSGIRPGEKIVTTSMASPVEGMSLRTSGADDRQFVSPDAIKLEEKDDRPNDQKQDKDNNQTPSLLSMSAEERRAFLGSMSPEERREYFMSLPAEEREKLRQMRQSGGPR